MRVKRAALKRPATAMSKRLFATNPPKYASGNRKIPAPICGRHPSHCRYFIEGRGAELARSFKEQSFATLTAGISVARIQTWNDAADIPHLVAQLKPRGGKYSWMFPLCFT